ncbi:2,3-diaminopropionate biosynthesis protein SbnB [Streptomyces mirabilis]|uniref:2,3-diaminopropionate biosynthesis protein SbnB n=1 Tax=Streptomyces mirabilis TaxID=68239 RepID=UPI0037176302
MKSEGFNIVSGRYIRSVLSDEMAQVKEVVRQAYVAHSKGESVLPQSVFLRFGIHGTSRIIALPACIPDAGLIGIKWIASVADNVTKGIPRASAVIVLNDAITGRPRACLEGAAISAYRTAASAVLCLEQITTGRNVGTVGVVGAGVIADTVLRYLVHEKWGIDHIAVHDLVPERAAEMVRRTSVLFPDTQVESVEQLGNVVTRSDVLVLATTASTPYLTNTGWFSHCPAILHLSLRDLDPDVLRIGQNIVDDPMHVTRERTSLHLAATECPDHNLIAGTVADLLEGRTSRNPDVPVIVSPFGLGILDLAVASFVYGRAVAHGAVTVITDFFEE